MASPTELAGEFYRLAKTDPTFEKTMRDAYKALLLGVADGSDVLEIFMGSKNGANYQGRFSVGQTDRRIAMKMAIEMLDGRPVSSNTGRLSF